MILQDPDLVKYLKGPRVDGGRALLAEPEGLLEGAEDDGHSVSEWFGALILTEEEVVTALVLC